MLVVRMPTTLCSLRQAILCNVSEQSSNRNQRSTHEGNKRRITKVHSRPTPTAAAPNCTTVVIVTTVKQGLNSWKSDVSSQRPLASMTDNRLM